MDGIIQISKHTSKKLPVIWIASIIVSLLNQTDSKIFNLFMKSVWLLNAIALQRLLLIQYKLKGKLSTLFIAKVF